MCVCYYDDALRTLEFFALRKHPHYKFQCFSLIIVSSANFQKFFVLSAAFGIRDWQWAFSTIGTCCSWICGCDEYVSWLHGDVLNFSATRRTAVATNTWLSGGGELADDEAVTANTQAEPGRRGEYRLTVLDVTGFKEDSRLIIGSGRYNSFRTSVAEIGTNYLDLNDPLDRVIHRGESVRQVMNAAEEVEKLINPSYWIDWFVPGLKTWREWGPDVLDLIGARRGDFVMTCVRYILHPYVWAFALSAFVPNFLVGYVIYAWLTAAIFVLIVLVFVNTGILVMIYKLLVNGCERMPLLRSHVEPTKGEGEMQTTKTNKLQEALRHCSLNLGGSALEIDPEQLAGVVDVFIILAAVIFAVSFIIYTELMASLYSGSGYFDAPFVVIWKQREYKYYLESEVFNSNGVSGKLGFLVFLAFLT